MPFVQSLVAIIMLCGTCRCADFTTENFRVTASSADVAQQIALRAEELRRSSALEWLGAELAPWRDRCAVTVDATTPSISGNTIYQLQRGDVRRWRMELCGEPQRILDVVLPHEVVHTVLASHFKRAIPRWADEGAALSAEDQRERDRLSRLEASRLTTDEPVPLATLLDIDEYPIDRDQVRRFYLQGASLTEFLLIAGKPMFIDFVSTGIEAGWEQAVHRHYGFESVAALEQAWQSWVRRNRPLITLEPTQLLVAAVSAGASPRGELMPVLSREPDDRVTIPVASVLATRRIGEQLVERASPDLNER